MKTMSLDRTIPPPLQDFGKLTIPPKSSLYLPNGLTLNTIRTGQSPANRLSVVWNYGYNRCEGSYAAAMVPQMIMQGSERMTGAEIVDQVDYLGAFLSHSNYSGYTAFEILSLNEFTPEMLGILEDIILNPIFPEDRFIALHRKAVANFEVNMTRTRFVATNELMKLLAGSNHPYDTPVTIERLQSLTLDQVKEAWSEGLKHTEMQLFVSGDITDTLKYQIVQSAKRLRPQYSSITAPIFTPHTPEAPGLRIIQMPESRQASIAIGIPTIGRDHPDYIPLRITIVALGGYFGSRLMTKIREEKGLTYGISANLIGKYEGASININADCDSTYVKEVLKEIKNEVRDLSTSLMGDDELARLRSYYMTTIAATLESFKSIGDYYENQVTVGIPQNYFDLQQTALENISPETIRTMANKYILLDKAITVIAGPDSGTALGQ